VPTTTRVEAEGQALDAARALMTEYLVWVIDASRAVGLDPETLRSHYYRDDTLPGAFAPPDGCLLIALPALGMVGYDRASADACEMKRLYVAPAGRGQGVARALVTRLMEEARAAGYKTMRLETRTFMTEAISLYEALGVRDCEAFHPIPESFRAATRFLSRDL
jgi:ribosomal protein S18 acetylase RimI-like enzyme